MIPEETIEQILTLLTQGVTQRGVAKITGVSRGTVGSIANGKYKIRKKKPVPIKVSKILQRCPDCGGKVYLPCLLCKIRKEKLLRKYNYVNTELRSWISEKIKPITDSELDKMDLDELEKFLKEEESNG